MYSYIKYVVLLLLFKHTIATSFYILNDTNTDNKTIDNKTVQLSVKQVENVVKSQDNGTQKEIKKISENVEIPVKIKEAHPEADIQKNVTDVQVAVKHDNTTEKPTDKALEKSLVSNTEKHLEKRAESAEENIRKVPDKHTNETKSNITTEARTGNLTNEDLLPVKPLQKDSNKEDTCTLAQPLEEKKATNVYIDEKASGIVRSELLRKLGNAIHNDPGSKTHVKVDEELETKNDPRYQVEVVEPTEVIDFNE